VETSLVPQQETDARPTPGAGPDQPLVLDAGSPAALTNVPPGAALPLLDAAGDVLPLEAIEAATIRFAISHYRGQMSEVARKLRIGRSTLYRKLDQLGLTAGQGKEDVADG
jgi:DNA-binding NtrC family response regulator